MRVHDNVTLGPSTSLKIGGPAARVADVDREGEVADAVSEGGGLGSLVVLGDGSNVVIGDEGFPGLVVRVDVRGVDVRRQGPKVSVDVGAGEPWDSLVERAVGEGWCGLEGLSGIPGRVGATPIQNVGAYGWDVGETIESVRAFDRAVGVFVDLPKAECEFGYRTSIFKREDRFIVTRVRFVFDVGEAAIVRYAEIGRALSVPSGASAPISRIRDAVVALRRTKGMVLDPADSDSVSAGSFFVNPVVDERTAAKVASLAGEPPPSFPLATGERKLAAAWLVERAGFTKGWSKGRVGVSRKHALALVNLGGATARELLAVAHEIRDGVRDLFGVELEPEPRFIGCAWNAVR